MTRSDMRTGLRVRLVRCSKPSLEGATGTLAAPYGPYGHQFYVFAVDPPWYGRHWSSYTLRWNELVVGAHNIELLVDGDADDNVVSDDSQ